MVKEIDWYCDLAGTGTQQDTDLGVGEHQIRVLEF